MTKAVEVITSVQRRRRWSRSEKERIVAATMEPGAIASEVARAEGIHSSQLFRWRQELCSGAHSAPEFSAVAVVGPTGTEPAALGSIEIEFASGTRMRISGSADPSTVRTMVAVLAKIERRR